MRWWLSFCDPDKPEGERFLGAAIINVENDVEDDDLGFLAAVHRAHRLGLNPGGEVAGVTLDEAEAPEGFDLTERFLGPYEATNQATESW